MEYCTLIVSNMNIVCIELSKAFDKVNLYGLAVKFMNRNLPKVPISKRCQTVTRCQIEDMQFDMTYVEE